MKQQIHKQFSKPNSYPGKKNSAKNESDVLSLAKLAERYVSTETAGIIHYIIAQTAFQTWNLPLLTEHTLNLKEILEDGTKTSALFDEQKPLIHVLLGEYYLAMCEPYQALTYIKKVEKILENTASLPALSKSIIFSDVKGTVQNTSITCNMIIGYQKNLPKEKQNLSPFESMLAVLLLLQSKLESALCNNNNNNNEFSKFYGDFLIVANLLLPHRLCRIHKDLADIFFGVAKILALVTEDKNESFSQEIEKLTQQAKKSYTLSLSLTEKETSQAEKLPILNNLTSLLLWEIKKSSSEDAVVSLQNDYLVYAHQRSAIEKSQLKKMKMKNAKNKKEKETELEVKRKAAEDEAKINSTTENEEENQHLSHSYNTSQPTFASELDTMLFQLEEEYKKGGNKDVAEKIEFMIKKADIYYCRAYSNTIDLIYSQNRTYDYLQLTNMTEGLIRRLNRLTRLKEKFELAEKVLSSAKQDLVQLGGLICKAYRELLSASQNDSMEPEKIQYLIYHTNTIAQSSAEFALRLKDTLLKFVPYMEERFKILVETGFLGVSTKQLDKTTTQLLFECIRSESKLTSVFTQVTALQQQNELQSNEAALSCAKKCLAAFDRKDYEAAHNAGTQAINWNQVGSANSYLAAQNFHRLGAIKAHAANRMIEERHSNFIEVQECVMASSEFFNNAISLYNQEIGYNNDNKKNCINNIKKIKKELQINSEILQEFNTANSSPRPM